MVDKIFSRGQNGLNRLMISERSAESLRCLRPIVFSRGLRRLNGLMLAERSAESL